MSIFVCSLNSGSNANCYYLGNEEEAVLVDAGLSCRETVKRLKRVGLSIQQVKAIFVSHEHSDHVTGIPVLARKFRIPVYLTEATRPYLESKVEDDLLHPVVPERPVRVGKLDVTGFAKKHDACDPLSFLVECGSVRVGVFTDIGEPCDNVIQYFRQCHAAFLEANYDEGMLLRGRYPIHLKRRIQSALGHLSNDQAVDLFVRHRAPFMTHLFLSHLSRENNSPEIVRNSFARVAGDTEIIIASRERETPLYQIRHDPRRSSLTPPPVAPGRFRARQLDLFS